MAVTKREQQVADQIAAKLTPEETAYFRSLLTVIAECDRMLALGARIVRWARQDPSGRRAVEDNLYVIVREIEELIGPVA